MNRAIHAETLKARFDDDGHLSGYIEEMINDCPTVKPDMNSVVDEVYTNSLMRGEWEEVDENIEFLQDFRREWGKCSMCAYLVAGEVQNLVVASDDIYAVLRKKRHAGFDAARARFEQAWAGALVSLLSCAGYLQIDAEKVLRERIEADRAKPYKRRTHAAAGN